LEPLAGLTVLQYEFLEKLGAGGMGEIYKAQDTRLNRFVAIKVLPADKSGNVERRRRFVQEAQAASALNHPNIITIHDIVSSGDTQYMVMEYVSGKTLLELIPAGGLRVPQVLQFATQMADALSTAHAAGIIHRDFKPANVMVTSSGLVKILDFGLAKVTDAANTTGPIGHEGDQVTVTTMPLTVEGSIMGTVSYMSPEQAEGKKLDTRSDIFSFGAVLYEMITGRRAFEGDSNISILSAVLRDEVKPLAEVAPDTPRGLQDIVSLCLRKHPDARWQSMREVEAALLALKRQSDSGTLYKTDLSAAAPATQRLAPPAAKPKSQVSRILAIGVFLLLAIAAAGGLLWMSRNKSSNKLPAPAPAQVAVQGNTQPPSAPSPPAAPTNPTPRQPDAVVTNDSILEMVQAKVPIPVIVGQIRSSKTNFNLSTEEVIRLTKAGVPGNVIEAMRNPKAAAAPVQAATPNAAPPAASATTTPVVPPSPAAATSQVAPVTVNDGLPLRIALAQDVPADVEGEQPLRFMVLDGLAVGGVMVIARGATVTGSTTTEIGKKFIGMGGGGRTAFRLLTAEAIDGQKLNVRATPLHRPDRPQIRRLEPVIRGNKSKDLAAPRGAEYIAYIDGDQTVTVRK